MKQQTKNRIDRTVYAKQDRQYRAFMPEATSRIREDVEWSITYSFNAKDAASPRVLLIGDSICNGYQEHLRKLLGEKMNVTYWISSKCVTDPDYFRELSRILNAARCDVISFNNGLHSLTSDRTEWEQAYRRGLKFIRKVQPRAKLALTLCTPLRPAEKTAISRALNGIALRIAQEEKLPVIDLFTPMDKLDRKTNWRDDYHFQPQVCVTQAEIMAEHLLALLPAKKLTRKLKQSGSATGPSGRIE